MIGLTASSEVLLDETHLTTCVFQVALKRRPRCRATTRKASELILKRIDLTCVVNLDQCGRQPRSTSGPPTIGCPPKACARTGRARRPHDERPVNTTVRIAAPPQRVFPIFSVSVPVNAMQQAAPRVRFDRCERGNGDVAEIADTVLVRSSSVIAGKRPPAEAASRDGDGLAPLAALAASQWRALAARANEPNGYYLPDWELAVNASARGRTGVAALAAWSTASSQDGAARLIGLMPAISLWRAYKIPLPVLLSADPYGTLCTPPLDRDMAEDAAAGLMIDRKSTRLNSSHIQKSRMPSSA